MSAHSETLLTLAEANAAVARMVSPIEAIERVPLRAADGRVLAAPLVAPCDLPPFDNAAVDGYALALATLPPDRILSLGVRIAAGAEARAALVPGTAARIFTGARVPPGVDAILMQEDAALEGSDLRVPVGLRAGANLRRRGEDVAKNAEALPAGRRLRPQDVALVAALGLAALDVARRPRAALFSTGDEIVEPGRPTGPGQRHDSNRIMLNALLARAGAVVTDLGILPDRREAIVAALGEAAATHDLILTSGGVSVGEEDHVRAAVEQIGRIDLWRLAIKPGRPLAFGRVDDALFVGLPGNPVSAFVTFARVVRPMLARLTGEAFAPEGFAVPAGFEHAKRRGVREFVRGVLRPGPDGWIAVKHGTDGAAILSSLTATNGLVEIDETVTRVAPGDGVIFLPYAGLF